MMAKCQGETGSPVHDQTTEQAEAQAEPQKEGKWTSLIGKNHENKRATKQKAGMCGDSSESIEQERIERILEGFGLLSFKVEGVDLSTMDGQATVDVPTGQPSLENVTAGMQPDLAQVQNADLSIIAETEKTDRKIAFMPGQEQEVSPSISMEANAPILQMEQGISQDPSGQAAAASVGGPNKTTESMAKQVFSNAMPNAANTGAVRPDQAKNENDAQAQIEQIDTVIASTILTTDQNIIEIPANSKKPTVLDEHKANTVMAAQNGQTDVPEQQQVTESLKSGNLQVESPQQAQSGQSKQWETDGGSAEQKGQKQSQSKVDAPSQPQATVNPLAASTPKEGSAIEANLKTESQQMDAQPSKADMTHNVMKIVDGISTQLKESTKEISVTLRPDFMGKMSIKLTMDSDGIKAQLKTENPAVREAISGQLTTLQEALKDKGVMVTQLEVTYEAPAFSGQRQFDGNGQQGTAQKNTRSRIMYVGGLNQADVFETVHDSDLAVRNSSVEFRA